MGEAQEGETQKVGASTNANPSSGGCEGGQKKCWWLPSASELEDLKAQQRQRKSQIHKPDLSQAMLEALENTDKKVMEELAKSVSSGLNVTATPLSSSIEPPQRVRRPPRRAKSMDNAVVKQQLLAGVNSATGGTGTAADMTQERTTSSPIPTAPAHALKGQDMKAWSANRRTGSLIGKGIPTPRSSNHSRQSLGTSSHHSSAVSTGTITDGEDSLGSNGSFRIASTATATAHRHTTSNAQIQRTSSVRRSLSSGQPISTAEIEAIIQQEKQLKNVFTEEWGVGDADRFVKELQEKGKLVHQSTGSTSVRSNISWNQLNQRIQASALKKAQEFRTLPKLKQAAFALVLSQLLTPQEREDLYQVFCQMNHQSRGGGRAASRKSVSISHKEAQQGYAKVFGDAQDIIVVVASAQSTAPTAPSEAVLDYSEFMVGAAIASYHHTHDPHPRTDRKETKRTQRLGDLSGESLLKAFCLFDAEGKGFISKDNLRQLCTHQDATTQRIIDHIMAQPDNDRSNINDNHHNISFADFVALFFGDEDAMHVGEGNNSPTKKLFKSDKSLKKDRKKKSSKREKKKKKKSSKDKKKERKKSKRKGTAITDCSSVGSGGLADDFSIDDSIDSRRLSEVGYDDISIDLSLESDSTSTSLDSSCVDLDRSTGMLDSSSRSRRLSPKRNDEKKKETKQQPLQPQRRVVSVFDWKNHANTRPSLKVQTIMANRKAKEADKCLKDKPASPSQPCKKKAVLPSNGPRSPRGSPQKKPTQRPTFPIDSPRSPQKMNAAKMALKGLPIAVDVSGDSDVAPPVTPKAITAPIQPPMIALSAPAPLPPQKRISNLGGISRTSRLSPPQHRASATGTDSAPIRPRRPSASTPDQHHPQTATVSSARVAPVQPTPQSTASSSAKAVSPSTQTVASVPSAGSKPASTAASGAPNFPINATRGRAASAPVAKPGLSANAARPASSPKPGLPGNVPRQKAGPRQAPSAVKRPNPASTTRPAASHTPRTPAPSQSFLKPHISSNTPRGATPQRALSTPAPPVSAKAVTSADREQDRVALQQRRTNHRPAHLSAKQSKAFLWELKMNTKDVSKKLKRLPKNKKRDPETFVDPDQPYMKELREVQAEVLPVWRKETYSYWI